MEIQLRVAQAEQLDINRGIIRLPDESLTRLGITSGDLIEIIGSSERRASLGGATHTMRV